MIEILPALKHFPTTAGRTVVRPNHKVRLQCRRPRGSTGWMLALRSLDWSRVVSGGPEWSEWSEWSEWFEIPAALWPRGPTLDAFRFHSAGSPTSLCSTYCRYVLEGIHTSNGPAEASKKCLREAAQLLLTEHDFRTERAVTGNTCTYFLRKGAIHLQKVIDLGLMDGQIDIYHHTVRDESLSFVVSDRMAAAAVSLYHIYRNSLVHTVPFQRSQDLQIEMKVR